MNWRKRSPEELYKLAVETFNYEPKTGALYYKHAPKQRDPYRRAGMFNAQGWRNVKFAGQTCSAAWVVWLLHHKVLPKEELDHKNLQRWDDRIENLREATRSQNCMNRIRPISKYGFRGVKKNHRKFSASLVKDQKSYYFGVFDTAEQAARAYDAGAKIHFGEFALLNFPEHIQRDWLYVAS